MFRKMNVYGKIDGHLIVSWPYFFFFFFFFKGNKSSTAVE